MPTNTPDNTQNSLSEILIKPSQQEVSGDFVDITKAEQMASCNAHCNGACGSH